MKPQPMSDAEIDAIWRDSSGRIISAADLKGVRAIIAARDAQWAAMIGEPVHMFRKAQCSDWYVGHADHQDGGGPYEERTLYAIKETP